MNWRNHFDWMPRGLDLVPESMRDDFLSAIMEIDFHTGNGNDHGEWLRLDRPLPMSQALGLQAMIQQLRIPNVSAVCWDGWGGPYPILGVRGRYRKPDGDPHTVEVFGVDHGAGITIICARVFEAVIPDWALIRKER